MTESQSALVVVGASAGGIEALSALVEALPASFPAPVVIAQHLGPDRPSALAEILARRAKLPVTLIQGRASLESGRIYVVPANLQVEISDGAVITHDGPTSGPKPSIDLLFQTAAEAYGEWLIAVVLSGGGSDGAAGARAVKQAGGTVIIQNPETASFRSMPESLAPSIVDLVVDLADLGPALTELLSGDPLPPRPDTDRLLAGFLDRLRERSGIDFRSYKRPTVARRLQRRIVATHSTSLRDYVRHCQRHPEEYRRLISSFLIKVTEFFRDAELFDDLRQRVLPELIESARQRNFELRVWSAGCSTGEEPYSLAILLAELLGKELSRFSVRIFATDLDADAIEFARRGVFPAASLDAVPHEVVERYFTQVGGGFLVNKQIRSLIVFGQHDLGRRAPFPRVDLTLCRNVLIYFTPELQRRALQLFAFSLRSGGVLVLGKSETTNSLSDYFSVDNLRLRIYRRQGTVALLPEGPPSGPVAKPAQPTRPAARQQGGHATALSVTHFPQRSEPSALADLESTLPIGIVVVDAHYHVQAVNTVARRLLGIHGTALGEDLIHQAQQLPAVALRAAIDAAFRATSAAPDRSPATLSEVEVLDSASGVPRVLDIRCYPRSSVEGGGGVEQVVILVDDVTAAVGRRSELERQLDEQRRRLDQLETQLRQVVESNRQLLVANEDLVTSNQRLRLENTDLLSAYEEAQSATEEVETLNEELQASNEELETLNEEQLATVEELNATNDDLSARGAELEVMARSLETQRLASEAERARLEAILLSMADGVAVIDSGGDAVLTNRAYLEMFGSSQPPAELTDERGAALEPGTGPFELAARGETFTVRFSQLSSAGNRRWFEASGRPISGPGTNGGSVVVVRDITDRSIRRLQDEFLALAGHELRTPLTVVQACFQMFQRRQPRGQDPRIDRYIELGMTQSRRLQMLIDDLLDVGRLQSGRLHLETERVDLSALVATAAEVAQNLTRGQTLVVSSAGESVWVEADGGRIEQVLFNLINNAISYAPGTDTIEIRLDSTDGQAVLQVTDHGPGISPEELPRIFSRFYQVLRADASESRGLGLGLFIVQQLVQAHGGSVEVESQLGRGTTFTVRLPLVELVPEPTAG